MILSFIKNIYKTTTKKGQIKNKKNCYWVLKKKNCNYYCGRTDHTHYGTPFLKPKAYKVRVECVSPRCEIEQIRVGGT